MVESIAEIEIRFDNKIQVFTETMEELVDKIIKRVIERFDEKISDLRNEVGEFKINIQRQINDFVSPVNKPSDEEGEKLPTLTEIKDLHEKIKEHHENITQLSKMHEDYAFKTLGFIDSGKMKKKKRDDTKTRQESVTANSSKHNIYLNGDISEHVINEANQQQYMEENTEKNFEEECGGINQLKRDLDLLICIDSNRKHINWRKFWTIDGTEKFYCGSLYTLKEKIINAKQINSVKYVLINVGVNDLDTQDAEEVYEKMEDVVNIIREKYKDCKIIISEITPRTDDRDNEVIKCNTLINQMSKNKEFIFIARQSNLRDDNGTMFDDAKHITRNAIPKFVANIKRVLEKAYGIERNQRANTRNLNSYYDRSNRNLNYRNMYRDNKWYNYSHEIQETRSGNNDILADITNILTRYNGRK